ncbi:gluconate 2-dehydrogenase subunit 3 family protein [Bradyrhizobium sp. Arg237L]|uniref:gluconate 2-dehydrogenase subunit 3 family protein n=1 Tax=Bradyrhizobium sp. Arg237L TaxID=3003352 RepID=UPI00249F6863|nr:gluconate 2-dehydrogenase subunit 3 family protein [Bradyrhizobium sp. Arg237L]MDI4239074.1 gluconate 2-dehydrogenase subunit 3 family protein [Bradyrhizobium sp. Arg237L]
MALTSGDAMAKLSRRSLIKASGPVGAALMSGSFPSAVTADAQAQHVHTHTAEAMGSPSVAKTPSGAGKPGDVKTGYLFLNSEEAAFIEAAVARLIPADDKWGGAIEAGVPNFIDKQLGGAWGAGERLYRSGPWQQGTATQGYQLPLTPAELFRTAMAAINSELKARSPFAQMSVADQEAYLRSLEAGGKDLGGVPSNEFFVTLWEITLEGFFSDPVYGGNRDMMAWRMIGFPGAYASYYDLVDRHGMDFQHTPTSLAEDVHGHVHVRTEIPARLPE